MERRGKVAIGAGIAIAALPCLVTSAVQRGWRSQTEAALAALEADGLGTSLEALGQDRPAGPAATALARRLDAFEGLPPAVSYMSGAGPVDVKRYLAGDRTVMVYDRAEDDAASPPDARAGAALLLERVARCEADADGLLRAKRPVRFPVDWSKGYAAEMPHLMGLKQLANGLRTRAAWRAQDGDAAGAWADAERLAKLPACLDDPVLIGRLVRIAVTQIATSTITELLELLPPPPAEQRARLDRALAALEDPDGHQRAMRGELGMFCRSIQLRGDELILEGQSVPVGGVARLRTRLLLEQWTRDFVLVMGRVIRACGQGDALGRQDALIAIADQAAGGTPLVQLLLPALPRAHSKELNMQAHLRLARVALRLGGDPSASPGELLADPWAGGRPLRWARAGGVGRLWSIGEDRTDEGGVLPVEGGDPDAPRPSPTDLVVRVGRRP